MHSPASASPVALQVGGLAQYVHALKEMVFLPLVYPELFSRFHVQPPRGGQRGRVGLTPGRHMDP